MCMCALERNCEWYERGSTGICGRAQIFQLALAAHEMVELDGLLCSIVDGPGKWVMLIEDSP